MSDSQDSATGNLPERTADQLETFWVHRRTMTWCSLIAVALFLTVATFVEIPSANAGLIRLALYIFAGAIAAFYTNAVISDVAAIIKGWQR